MNNLSRSFTVKRGFRRIGFALALLAGGYTLFDHGGLSFRTLDYDQGRFIALRCADARLPPAFEIPEQDRSYKARFEKDWVSQFMTEMEARQRRKANPGALDPKDVPISRDGTGIDVHEIGCGAYGSASIEEIVATRDEAFGYYRQALTLLAADFAWALALGVACLVSIEILAWLVCGFVRN